MRTRTLDSQDTSKGGPLSALVIKEPLMQRSDPLHRLKTARHLDHKQAGLLFFFFGIQGIIFLDDELYGAVVYLQEKHPA